MRLESLPTIHLAILSRLPSGIICQSTSRAYIAHGRVQDVWQLSTILTAPAFRLTVAVLGVGDNAATTVRQRDRRELMVICPSIRGDAAVRGLYTRSSIAAIIREDGCAQRTDAPRDPVGRVIAVGGCPGCGHHDQSVARTVVPVTLDEVRITRKRCAARDNIGAIVPHAVVREAPMGLGIGYYFSNRYHYPRILSCILIITPSLLLIVIAPIIRGISMLAARALVDYSGIAERLSNCRHVFFRNAP